LCGSRKYPYPHHRGSLEILRERVLFFKGKYESKLEFPEGRGAQSQKTLCGGSMDIFWNNKLSSQYEIKPFYHTIMWPNSMENTLTS